MIRLEQGAGGGSVDATQKDDSIHYETKDDEEEGKGQSNKTGDRGGESVAGEGAGLSSRGSVRFRRWCCVVVGVFVRAIFEGEWR